MSRPLAVLLLVLAAVLAVVVGFFVLQRSEKPPVAATPGGAAPVEHAAATPDEPSPPADQRQAPPTAVAESTSDDDTPPAALSNSLVGIVLNDRNEPIAGATVKLSRDAMTGDAIANQWFGGYEPSGIPPLSSVSNAKGQFVFRGIEPAKDYFLLATHTDYSQAQEELVAVARAGESRAPDLVMRTGSRLTGFVADVEGNQVPNAKLHLDSAYMMGLEQASPDRLTVTTDNTGGFEFKNVGAGPRNLMCEAEGYGLQIKHNIVFKGDASENLEHQFRLQLGVPIGGRVFGPEDEGVVGCKVVALNYGNNTSSRGEALTDELGNFQINGLEAGSYILLLEPKGYRQARQNRVQAGELNVQIPMIRQASITGRVFASGTNEAVTNFSASLHRVNSASGQPGGNQQPLYETTGVKEKVEGSTDGSFLLVGVDPGRFAIKVTAKDFAPRMSDEFTVVEGQPTPPVQIALSQGGSIRGRVVDARGNPVSGVQIATRDDEFASAMFDDFIDGLVATRTTDRKTRSNEDGFYELKQLNPGKYRVVMEHSSFTNEILRGVIVTEGKQTDSGSVALKSGGSVRGRVLDQAGKPLSRGWVRMFNDEGGNYQTRTDTEGRYAIEHITPGNYRLSATRSAASGGDVFETLLEGQTSEQTVNVVEGQESNLDLNVGN